MDISQPDKRNLLLAVDVFSVVAEFNALEQELDKILSSYYCPLSYDPAKSEVFISEVLRSGKISFENKTYFVSHIPQVACRKDIKMQSLRDCAQCRNELMHGVYTTENSAGECFEQQAIGKHVVLFNIEDKVKDFHKFCTAARDEIVKIAKMLNLQVINRSIQL